VSCTSIGTTKRPRRTPTTRLFYGGHYYSDKIIGLSLVALPVYAVIRGVSNVFDAEPDFQLTQFLLTTRHRSACRPRWLRC
jgi:hypothetical protein